MNGELTDLNSTRVQTTVWIRFMVEVEDENGNIGVNRVEKTFNSQMTDIFQGGNFNEIIDEIFAQMKDTDRKPSIGK